MRRIHVQADDPYDQRADTSQNARLGGSPAAPTLKLCRSYTEADAPQEPCPGAGPIEPMSRLRPRMIYAEAKVYRTHGEAETSYDPRRGGNPEGPTHRE